MKNRELIAGINFLADVKERQIKKGKKIFTGRALLIVTRNLRTMLNEYKENYEKDYDELRGRYYVMKEQEVTIPEDKEKGIEEHKEKQQVEVMKPNCKEEDYMRELNELLDLDVKIPLLYLTLDDLVLLDNYEDAERIDFMVK